MTPAHRLYSASTSPFALVKLQRKVQTSWSYCLSKIPLRNELSWTHYTLSMSLPREKWRRPSVASLAPCLFPLFSWGQGQLRSRRRLAGRLVLPDSFFVYNFHWWRFSLATNKGEGSCGGRAGGGGRWSLSFLGTCAVIKFLSSTLWPCLSLLPFVNTVSEHILSI